MNHSILLCTLASLSLTAADQISVTLNGNTSGELQTAFPGGYILHQPFSARYRNKQFNFDQAYLTRPGKRAIPLGQSGDDACPWNCNHTYIGANHGDSNAYAIICEKEHGLTEKDCGTTWKDSKGKNFHIVKIENPKIVWVLSDNISRDQQFWQFIKPAAATLKTGSRTLSRFKVEYRQLYSPVRITRRTLLADGKVLPPKGKFTCKLFTVEEEYDIIATDAILKHVLANKGRQVAFNSPGLEAFLSQKICYNFYPNGSCIVTHNTAFHRDVRLGYMGFLQAGQLSKGNYAKHLYYIPKCLPVKYEGEIWDFANRVDYTRPIKGALLIGPEYFENPKSMPERFVQYLQEGKDQPDVGFAIGYSMVEGCTTPEEHLKGAKQALFLWRSHKSYPHAIDSGKIPRIKAGQKFYCMAFRQYFDPNRGYYMNQQGKYQIVYADFHAPVKDKLLVMPAELMQKKMSIIEKSPTVTADKAANGYKFTSTGKYGYAVLQFE